MLFLLYSGGDGSIDEVVSCGGGALFLLPAVLLLCMLPGGVVGCFCCLCLLVEVKCQFFQKLTGRSMYVTHHGVSFEVIGNEFLRSAPSEMASGLDRHFASGEV